MGFGLLIESEMNSYVSAQLALRADDRAAHEKLYRFADPARDRYAAENPHIQQAARANTEENFGYVFDRQFEGLVLDRHDANADLIGRVFQDADTTAFFTAMARRVVYELARDAGAAG